MTSRSLSSTTQNFLALGLVLFSLTATGQDGARARPFTMTHYSPFENLERLEHEQLARAHRTLDIAMYSFTDLYLAQELRDLAIQHQVHIRIYRDREQFLNEQRAADRHRSRGPLSTTDLLRGTPNIEIRVKSSSSRNIMHLKAYVLDQALFRDGSANWSPAGLKDQDNTLRFTNEPDDLERFQVAFESMWKRPDNLKVQ